MKRRGWKIVFIVAMIVFVASVTALGLIAFSYFQGQQKYGETAEKADFDPSELDGGSALSEVTVDWDALREVNPDTVGWIYIPNTAINYPVVQGEDNEHYLTYDFDGSEGWLAEYGAIFLMKIGGALKSGKKHDGRSPDYDDWELNGDIILWNDLLERSFEISSMGIRVDAEAMRRQLELADCMDRAELPYQQAVMNDELPLTIGGGIGQSRLCMFFLRKAHIGEVQVSVWPAEQVRICEENNIHLL